LGQGQSLNSLKKEKMTSAALIFSTPYTSFYKNVDIYRMGTLGQQSSVADSGSGAFFTPGIRIGDEFFPDLEFQK
jgi:hypothetical protein